MENDNENEKLVKNDIEKENEKKDEVAAKEENKEEENKEEANKEDDNKVGDKVKKKGEKEEKKKEEIKIVFMKKGSYSVHILIQEIKNIEKKDADAAGAYPIIKMTVFGETKRTSKIEVNNDYFFGEHFYFEKSKMLTEQLEKEKISFEVYDYHFTDRKDYLGIYETDFQHIYNQPKHCSQNFWIALANPESNDFTKIRGYLRLSLSVLNDSDDRIELKEERSSNADSPLLMPPQIRLQYKQLKIQFLEAQQLPDMDDLFNYFKKKKFNECDAYVSIQFMGNKLNTSVSEMKKNVSKWCETIYIPIVFPIVSHKMKMSVYDKDPGMSEIIGSYEIDLDKVFKDDYKKWQFVHIYGSPLKTMGKYTNKMNEFPEIGSTWKGKIYMKIDYEDDPSVPKTELKKMDSLIESEGYKCMEKCYFWTVNVVLHEAFFLPEDNKYKIMVCVENNSACSIETKAEENYINFGKFKASLKAQSSLNDLNSIGDLFIYLVKDDKRICFQRFPCSMFSSKNETILVKLLPDFAIGEIKEPRKAGILKIEIGIKQNDFLLVENDLNSSYNSLNNDIQLIDLKTCLNNLNLANSNFKNYYVIMNIYQSRYLVSGDNDGTSDPYVKVKLGKQILKTTIKNDTINPIWNEFLVFKDVMFDYNDPNSWPILYLECLDYDFSLFSDDCIGYSYIWLNDTSHCLNTIKTYVKPTWTQLYLPLSNRRQGQLLLSFFILEKEKFPDSEKFVKEINIYPEIRKFTFEINILGLRDLQPLSLLPVKKPFIIFDVNSINFIKKEQLLEDGKKKDNKDSSMQLSSIKTQPKETGSSPNITTVLKFDVNLPLDSVHIPQLQCMVKDSMLAGLLNQLLGVFMIDIKRIINEYKEVFEKDLKTLKKNMLKYDAEIKNHYKNKVGENVTKRALNILDKLKNSEENKKDVEININVKNENEKDKLLGDNLVKQKSLPKSTGSFKKNKNEEKETIYIPEENEDPLLPIVKRPVYKTYDLPGTNKNPSGPTKFRIEDEIKMGDEWMEVGFNKSEEDNKKFKKHFRRKLNTELEKSNFANIKSPFETFSVRRGKYEDKQEMAQIFEAISNPNNKIFKYIKRSDILNEEEEKKETDRINELNKSIESQKLLDLKSYGSFKGLIRIIEKEKYYSSIHCINTLTAIGKMNYDEYPYLQKYNFISKEILCPVSVVVNIYILEFLKIKQKDLLSFSDPFIKIKLGDQVIDDIQNRETDKENWKVYRLFQLNAKLSEANRLVIELYDYDDIFPNELIGTTVIDIEDRYYDSNWRNLKHKPIELRSIRDPDLPEEQAQLLMWLEVYDKTKRSEVPIWDITPPPEMEMEVRLIVWETKEVPFADVEETSDIYITAFFDRDIKKSTDVHYRCQDGNGSFNYRVLIPIKYQSNNNNTILNIQVFDNDILSHDDFICGNELDLTMMIKDLYKLNIPLKFDISYFNDICAKYPGLKDIIYFENPRDEKTIFWLKCFRTENTERKQVGQVKLSLEILPKDKAQASKVGDGRNEPNINPYLPPPQGRFEWSLNPFKMFNQLVGPGIRHKVYCACCIVFCVIIMMVFLPYIAMHVAAEFLNPFNYKTSNTTKLMLA